MLLQQLHVNKITLCLTSVLPLCSYILWRLYWYHEGADSKKYKKKLKHSIPGLVNGGNTCFMNSLLQCIASQSSFTKWLEYVSRASHVKGHILLAETLNNLMQVLSNDKDHGYVDSTYLLNDLMSRGWHISYEEHDAHEFFHCIMTTLDEELSSRKLDISLSSVSGLDQKLSLQENTISDICRYKQKTTKHDAGDTEPHFTKKHNFHGMLSIRLRCLKCGNQNPITYESFDSLSLSLNVYPQQTLLDCLRKFFACELLDDVRCNSCRTKNKTADSKSTKASNQVVKSRLDVHSLFTTITTSQFVRKISNMGFSLPQKPSPQPLQGSQIQTTSFYKLSHISKFPQCLCIHLQRLVWKHGQPTKLSHHIAFPEVLDMGQFMYNFENKKTSQSFVPTSNPIISSIITNRPHTNAKLRMNFVTKFRECNGLRGGNLESSLNNIATGKCLYQLTGVIVHIGNWSFNGHFIAYRRHVLKDSDGKISVQWFYASDTTIKKVSIENVLQSPAYMLFYERISKTF